MSGVTVVTSMSKEIYEGYGQDFLRTFEQHWPKTTKLVVYADTDLYESAPESADEIIEAAHEVQGLHIWELNIAPFPVMHGKMGDGKYEINYDARQARKVFIQAHACETFGGRVVWLDADVITHAPVPADFIHKIVPDDKMCAYLGRDGWYYTETGFVAWNADHPGTRVFVKGWRDIYQKGAIFMLPGWHDCYGFDALRKTIPPKFFVNLAEGLPEGTMHPFINSVLGSVMDHRKGNRKKTRSTKEDLVVERTEPYWKFSIG